MADLSRDIAADLLKIGAVRLSPQKPFTWTSGLRSPIYCDNRLTIGFPEVRSRITDGFASMLTEAGLQPDIIAATATAAIPHGAWLADRLSLPLIYVRSKAKQHGAGRQIEGPFKEGQHVVLVEDLVSTGGSSVAAVRALRAEGLAVDLVASIFSYELPAAREAFASEQIAARFLTSIEKLLEAAGDTEEFDAAEIESVRRWQSDPTAWSQQAEQRVVHDS
jgi:orotate phosphoribosyltransferase